MVNVTIRAIPNDAKIQILKHYVVIQESIGILTCKVREISQLHCIVTKDNLKKDLFIPIESKDVDMEIVLNEKENNIKI